MMSSTPKPTEPRAYASRIAETPIAIVGMSCLMPDARSLPEFWDNILEKIDSVIDVPPDRWNPEWYYDADPFAPDKTYCKRGAFIPSIEFNPMEWGLPPNLLQVTDTSQLLSLVVAKDCLADAGIHADSQHDRDKIGIVLGIGGGQKLIGPLAGRMQYPVLERVLRKAGLPEAKIPEIVELYKSQYPRWDENTFPGSLGNVIAGRIANRLNLGGINTVTDAACASSLSAVRMAVHELLEGHSDLMITGGTCTDNSVAMYMSFSKTPAFTRDDRSRPFDRKSAGMLVGEGIGMVALKRLPDAERDGDRIYAVLRGVGASSDGRCKSIYAPRPEGQAKALVRAYEDAGFDPSTVTLIEAHGTGTLAGDVAEVQGLASVFQRRDPEQPHIAIGSIKSQIGHLKAAAGIAGLIKAALALHHKVLPATINVDEPNPKLELDKTPFYVNTETRPWVLPADGTPRRAGLSAFGFGGTNFHVVLEEHRASAEGRYRLHVPGHVFLLEARNPAELVLLTQQLVSALEAASNRFQFAELAEAHPLRPVPVDHARVGFVARDAGEAAGLLKSLTVALRADPSMLSWDSVKGLWYRAKGEDFQGKVAALFPGQGSQYVGMGGDLIGNFPVAMGMMQAVDAACHARGAKPVSSFIYPPPAFEGEARQAQETLLRNTEWAQPAIGSFSAAAFEVARAAGFQPDFVAGHSFGELTALWAAGVLDTQTFSKLAVARGQAMRAQPGLDAGSMAAVVGEVDALPRVLQAHPAISIANYNSPRQVVIGGPSSAIAACKDALETHGFRVVPLPVSAAFHTPLVEHASAPLVAALDAAELRAPQIAVYANGTGQRHPEDAGAIREALKEHVLRAVRFREQIEAMYEAGARVFVEFGPKNVLTSLVHETLAGRPHMAVATNPTPKKSADWQLRSALTRLAVAGVPLRDIDPHRALVRAPHTFDKSPLQITLSAPNYIGKELQELRAEVEAAVPVEEVVAEDELELASEESLHEELDDEDGYVEQPAAFAAIDQGQAAANGHQHVNGEMYDSNYTEITMAEASEELDSTEHGTWTPGPEQLAETQVLDDDRVGAASGLGTVLSRFYQWEGQALRAHEQYLETPREYTSAFLGLLHKQLEIAAANPGFEVPASMERSLALFHDHQSQTLRVHESYLAQQCDTARAALQVMAHHYVDGADIGVIGSEAPRVRAALSSPPAEGMGRRAPTRAQNGGTPALSNGERARAKAAKSAPMLGKGANGNGHAVSGQNGAAAKGQNGSAPAASATPNGKQSAPAAKPANDRRPPAGLAKLLASSGIEIPGGMPAASPTPASASAGAAPGSKLDEAAAVASALLSSGEPIDMEKMSNLMLEVVAEKTGYPANMLELGMDMESDLGIDSIKRVEILGTIQERFPNLPDLDLAVLAELRTLKQVAEYVQAALSGKLPPRALPADAGPVADGSASAASAAPAAEASAAQPVDAVIIGEASGAGPAATAESSAEKKNRAPDSGPLAATFT